MLLNEYRQENTLYLFSIDSIQDLFDSLLLIGRWCIANMGASRA